MRLDNKDCSAPVILAQMKELLKKLDELQASLPPQEASEKSTTKKVG